MNCSDFQRRLLIDPRSPDLADAAQARVCDDAPARLAEALAFETRIDAALDTPPPAGLASSASWRPFQRTRARHGQTRHAVGGRWRFVGKVRTTLAEQLNLIEQGVFKFCWVVDFPYYEGNADDNKIDFSHNPFSMPQGGLEALNAPKTPEELLAIKAFQYDIVCNGVELSSGAIRNHKPEIMVRAFETAGYSKADVENKFAALFNAFHYGAPPHGGLAPGIDRMVMLLANEPNIREVICLPMNQQAQDLLMQAPNVATEKALRELHIQLSPKAKQLLEEERAKAAEAAA